jgi:hypothetical protein
MDVHFWNRCEYFKLFSKPEKISKIVRATEIFIEFGFPSNYYIKGGFNRFLNRFFVLSPVCKKLGVSQKKPEIRILFFNFCETFFLKCTCTRTHDNINLFLRETRNFYLLWRWIILFLFYIYKQQKSFVFCFCKRVSNLCWCFFVRGRQIVSFEYLVLAEYSNEYCHSRRE